MVLISTVCSFHRFCDGCEKLRSIFDDQLMASTISLRLCFITSIASSGPRSVHVSSVASTIQCAFSSYLPQQSWCAFWFVLSFSVSDWQLVASTILFRPRNVGCPKISVLSGGSVAVTSTVEPGVWYRNFP